MSIKKVAFLASTLILGAAAAQAGGFVAPVVETEPAAPVVIAPVAGAWQGGYGGLTLGYAFKGEDRVGLTAGDDYLGDIGDLDLKGANAGLRAGYRWQRNNWVFGPEIGVEGGNIESDVSGVSADGFVGEMDAKVNHMVALRFKTGYAVRPDMLVYGIAGVGRIDVDYDLNGEEQNLSETGYILGMGVEKQINDKWSVTGEYEYANFGKTDLTYAGQVTEATPKYNNVKLGVNFRF